MGSGRDIEKAVGTIRLDLRKQASALKIIRVAYREVIGRFWESVKTPEASKGLREVGTNSYPSTGMLDGINKTRRGTGRTIQRDGGAKGGRTNNTAALERSEEIDLGNGRVPR